MLQFGLYFDIALVLTALTLFTGFLSLIKLICYRKLQSQHSLIATLVDSGASLFPMLLVVLIIRSFIVQPYRVPTGSLEPTIMPGDFIVVNQFAYGLRLPVLNKKIIEVGHPQRGELALFRYPVNPEVIYVKRVIGVPGDHIIYRNKQLIINGVPMSQQVVGIELESGSGVYTPVQRLLEDLAGTQHYIYIKPGYNESEEIEITVPEGCYFMMGDNRDNSNDSRRWGVVPEANLVGKAFGIWMSWDQIDKSVRWSRIGSRVA